MFHLSLIERSESEVRHRTPNARRCTYMVIPHKVLQRTTCCTKCNPQNFERINISQPESFSSFVFQSSSGQSYLMVTPGSSLYFPAVDFIRASVDRVAVKQGASHLPVVLDCRFILGADYTAAKVNVFCELLEKH